MSRKIIQIDDTKCVGCGLCANACQQSAIEMVNGKAKVVHDDYCDGIGNCLPVCPVGAISFSDREIINKKPVVPTPSPSLPCGCPSSNAKELVKNAQPDTTSEPAHSTLVSSQLKQWPVQIKLVSTTAAYFNQAHLLIAADCTAYAYANFHSEFMKNKITLIGCPKLDDIDYTEKLTEIIANNDLKSVTIVRMEVPCCGGLEHASVNALKNSGKFLPWQVVTISLDGDILDI